MNKDKLTPWFDGREFYAPCSYWDGRYWHDGAPSPKLAHQYGHTQGIPGMEYSEAQHAPWRGLSSAPKGNT